MTLKSFLPFLHSSLSPFPHSSPLLSPFPFQVAILHGKQGDTGKQNQKIFTLPSVSQGHSL